MPRDPGLEFMVNDRLAGERGLTTKAMFGGLCWMQHGNLLCGAGSRGVIFRLGAENVAWALEQPGMTPMMSGTRPMRGWVRATPEACGESELFERLMASALAFVATLPRK